MIIAYCISMVFLLILSIIDVKTFHKKGGFIPSYLTTMFILIVFVLMGVDGIIVGLMGILISLFFIDLDIFQGVPDIKIFIAMAITMPNMMFVGVLGLVTCSCLAIYKLTYGKNKDTIPGIPFLLVAYAITVSGVMIG